MSEVLQIVGITFLYFLVGQLVLLNYLLNYNPPDRSVWLGLQSLFWPVFLVLDVVFQLAAGLGGFSRRVSTRLETRVKKG